MPGGGIFPPPSFRLSGGGELTATTRLITHHISKGETIAQSLKDRFDYGQNPEKTQGGELISAYECDHRTADAEFLLAKAKYKAVTGREQKRDADVLCYQIRQSFRPGEITPEEANRVGYETAMRWTKGKHAFFVATHTDRQHIHNHIYYNSTTLDYTGKFRDFFRSAAALRRLSDRVCLEHDLSVIQNPKLHSKGRFLHYGQWIGERPPSAQQRVRLAIVEALGKQPADFAAFLRLMEESGFQVKHGRGGAISFLAPGQDKYTRLRASTLGDGFDPEGIRAVIAGEQPIPELPEDSPAPPRRVNLIIDIQNRLAQGKGPAYERWAKVYNLKQMAAALLYLREHGLTDYVTELAGEGTLTVPVFFQSPERSGRDRADMDDYKVKLSVAFCFSNRVSIVEHYHNSSFLEHGGSPEKATRLALVGAIDKYLRENNKYLKSEAKITYPDVQDCLILVSNNFSTQTSYENQTKKAITNKFVQDAMAEFLRSRLEIYFIENHDAAEKIAAQVLINKRSRETAEKTRINQKKKLTEKIDIANRVQKFVDCRTKDVERRELYIVEGDSALGACKQSRDAEFQGLMPVRGKILNCLKADYPRIFKSDVITDLMKVLGCGVEVSGKAVKDLNQFDLNNLRWNKVVICTDGDVDGFQIRTLILTMLYRLCPTLIREGKVYIAETPLFEITYKEKTAEKTWFAYSEKEKADILRSLEGKKVKIDRSKGLGENDPEMMWLTTMNPETRRLIKVLPDDVEETARVFDLLLGDNLSGRKEYIAENGHKYMDMIDVS